MQSCLTHTHQEKPPLLQVKDFYCYYPIRKGLFKRVVDHVRAVDGVSFDIQQGKTLALVGESGCGKTTLGKSLLNLIPDGSGQVTINGVDLNNLTGEALRQQRANIQIVFQDPFSSMNPRMLVGDIIAEGIRALHPEIRFLRAQGKSPSNCCSKSVYPWIRLCGIRMNFPAVSGNAFV